MTDPRKATALEQEKIDAANVILADVNLTVFALVDNGGGAVIPSKGF